MGNSSGGIAIPLPFHLSASKNYWLINREMYVSKHMVLLRFTIHDRVEAASGVTCIRIWTTIDGVVVHTGCYRIISCPRFDVVVAGARVDDIITRAGCYLIRFYPRCDIFVPISCNNFVVPTARLHRLYSVPCRDVVGVDSSLYVSIAVSCHDNVVSISRTYGEVTVPQRYLVGFNSGADDVVSIGRSIHRVEAAQSDEHGEGGYGDVVTTHCAVHEVASGRGN